MHTTYNTTGILNIIPRFSNFFDVPLHFIYYAITKRKKSSILNFLNLYVSYHVGPYPYFLYLFVVYYLSCVTV